MHRRQLVPLAFLLVGCALIAIGASPLGSGFLRLFGSGAALLQNPIYLKAGLVLSGISMLGYSAVVLRGKVESRMVALFHFVAVGALLHVSLSLVQFWKYVAQVVPFTPSESVVFLQAVYGRSITGLYLLSNSAEPPFLIPIYPPVYYIAQKILFPFISQSPIVGRYVSILAVLATAVLLGVVARIVLEKTAPPLLPSLLFLAFFPTLALSGSILKPDFLAASLSFAGLAVYVSRGLTAKPWVTLCSILCGLALLTKQTAFASILAISVHLLVQRRYRECLGLIFLTFLLVGGVYALLWLPTQGGIWFMTVTANAIHLVLRRGIVFFVQYMSEVFVLLALAASIAFLTEKELRQERSTVISLYFLVALGWFFASVGRPGASNSYFAEAAIGGSLVIGLLASRHSLAAERSAFSTIVLVVLLGSMLPQLYLRLSETARAKYSDEGSSEVVRVVQGLRTRPDEYILTDYFYVREIFQAGHRPLIIDSLMYTLLSDNGAVDTRPLVRVLQERKVRYLVLRQPLSEQANLPYLPHSVLTWLSENYACNPVAKSVEGEDYPILCQPRF